MRTVDCGDVYSRNIFSSKGKFYSGGVFGSVTVCVMNFFRGEGVVSAPKDMTYRS